MKAMHACKTEPADPPTNKPSFLIKALELVNDGRSSVLYHLSTHSLMQVFGTKSYPIPSTLFGGASVFKFPGMARMLPNGSAPTMVILGSRVLIFLAIPAMVPPVPTPTTTASILPSHW